MAAPQKLQLVKMTDFGKSRLAKRLVPPHLFEGRKLKTLQNDINNLLRKIHRIFFENLPVRRENRL